MQNCSDCVLWEQMEAYCSVCVLWEQMEAYFLNYCTRSSVQILTVELLSSRDEDLVDERGNTRILEEKR